MNEQDFLASYSGQTTAELLALEEIYRVDSIIMAFEEALEQKSVRQGSSNLTSLERMILAVEALEREVNNGGYDQYFRNLSVEYTPLVAALDAIGCPQTAQITLDAISALELSLTPTADEIENVMSTNDADRDEKLNECDSCYYVTGESIALALFTYIKSHSNEVQLP